jgi:dienelactone hydrolase
MQSALFYASFLITLSLNLFSWGYAQSYEAPGPFRVGERDFNFTDPSLPAGNQRVPGKVFFPATEANPAALPNDTFPCIAFGHGFNIGYLSYRTIYRHLASWGYIVITPDVQNGVNVNHRTFALQLAACLRYLKQEAQKEESFYFQKIASVSACIGHSMGGGSSFLVPSVWDSVTAIVGLAPAETNPSAIEALKNSQTPILIISGSADNTTPEGQHQIPMYNATPAQKLWISLRGGAHCKFTDGTTICDLVSSPGTITREEQLRLTQKYVTPFLEFFLKNKKPAQTYICGDSIVADSAARRLQFSTNISCTPPTATASEKSKTPAALCYPSTISREVYVWVASPGVLSFFDNSGKKVYERILEDAGLHTILLPSIASGLLSWRFENGKGYESGKVIKIN